MVITHEGTLNLLCSLDKTTAMTGKDYEEKVASALKQFTNYTVKEQVPLGQKRWGGGRIVDITLDDKIIVSLKHQENKGSLDEKNIAEVIDLDYAVQDSGYERAVLVLSDPNNRMRTRVWMKSKKNLRSLGVNTNNVEVITHETFMRKYVMPPGGFRAYYADNRI
jgi:hypothetical protein